MTPDLADVVERLDRLERHNDRLLRQNRRLKRAGGVGAALAVAVTLASCHGNTRGTAVHGTVEAERVVLKDADGRTHATFAVSPDRAALLFFDPAEPAKPRAGLASTGHGPTFSMYDAAGKQRLALSCNDAGSAVTLLGEDGRSRAGVTATATFSAVELMDGGRRVELSLTPEFHRVGFFQDNAARALWIVTKTEAALSLLGPDRSSVFLENSPGQQRLMIQNGTEVPRAGLAVTPQGTALGLFDDQGKVLFSKP
jgi:hypothetical protein